MPDGTIELVGVATPTTWPASNKLKIYKVSGSNQLKAIDSTGATYFLTPEKLNNYAGTVAPGTGDDSADGYGIGSVWVDTVLDDAYICLDATVAAAVWKKTTP
jgi:hypothetical protein